MTNKEAIAVLNMVEAHGSIVIQAKEMAIKALEQEPCDDAISRKEVLKILPAFGFNGINDYLDAKNEIEKFPHVTPQPKIGHWNSWFTEIKGNNTFNCMECGSTFIVEQGAHDMNYCPNCGAKMLPTDSEKE